MSRIKNLVKKCKLALAPKFVHVAREFAYLRWIWWFEDRTSPHFDPETGPLISIVMPVYKPPRKWLEEAINSVKAQSYPKWELCIADDNSGDPALKGYLSGLAAGDGRIKVIFREENGNIAKASNSAAALATGSWIALMDQDDIIPTHALACVADAIIRQPNAGLIYTDEDKLDFGLLRVFPYFKPKFNIDLLRSQNFINHLGVYRRDIFDAIDGFREGVDGSQDHDLVLRFVERLRPDQIVHIPRVLYRWRVNRKSASSVPVSRVDALRSARKVIFDHLERVGVDGHVEILSTGYYRCHIKPTGEYPLVSIIIPTKNRLDLLKKCVESIRHSTSYSTYEIIIVDNGSDDPLTLDYLRAIEKDGVKVIARPGAFNFSKLANDGAGAASGSMLLFLNNDTEVISPGWLDEMVGCCSIDVAIVGARLWFADGRVQHAGVMLCGAQIAVHKFSGLRRSQQSYFRHLDLVHEVSAVTGACMLIRREVFARVNGFDEVNLPTSYDDVDICLRVRELGYRVIYTPFAELYHYESASRGYATTPDKMIAEEKARTYMRQRWGDKLFADPFYSPNLSQKRLFMMR